MNAFDEPKAKKRIQLVIALSVFKIRSTSAMDGVNFNVGGVTKLSYTR